MKKKNNFSLAKFLSLSSLFYQAEPEMIEADEVTGCLNVGTNYDSNNVLSLNII